MAKLKTDVIEKYWHGLFEIGIFIKGIHGVVEIIGGFLIFFVNKSAALAILSRLARGELLEDPHDKIINFLTTSLQHISSNTITFVAVYILVHGIINVFLAIQLYRERLWAYLVAMGVMSMFILYQLYRINHGHSRFLAVITIFDILFIIITWHEYRYRRSLKVQ